MLKMDCVQVILQYNGVWDANGNFKDYKVSGIILPCTANYEKLCEIISQNLYLNRNYTTISIMYKIQEDYPAFNIENDFNLSFYIELKRKETNVMKYPLCLTIVAKDHLLNQIEDNDREILPQAYLIEIENEDPTISEDSTLGYLPEMLQLTNRIAKDGINCIESESEHDEADSTDDDDFENPPILKEGLVFSCKQTVKHVISHYALQNHFSFKVDKSCRRNYFISCVNEKCSWVFKSSSIMNTDAFKVRKFYNVHSCPIEERFTEHRQASSTFLANIIKKKFAISKQPYGPLNIQEDIKAKYGIKINYQKAWRAKEKAAEQVLGNASESYRALPSYLYMLKKTNPGTFTKLKTSEDR